jgi:hypothetical protein
VNEDVSLVVQTERGTVTIEAETALSTFRISGGPDLPEFPTLHRASVRYRWDGEEAYGLLERSAPYEKIAVS